MLSIDKLPIPSVWSKNIINFIEKIVALKNPYIVEIDLKIIYF